MDIERVIHKAKMNPLIEIKVFDEYYTYRELEDKGFFNTNYRVRKENK